MSTSIRISNNVKTYDAEQLKNILVKKGAIIFEEESGFFSKEEWETLEKLGLESGMPYETVHIGDAGEPNLVEVGRLMTDVEKPEIANAILSQPMLDILSAPSRMALFSDLTDIENLFVRRAQINKMRDGSFIGRHIDQDSNPDYGISIVLQFGQEFSGGDFVIQLPDGQSTSITPSFRSVTITRCDYAHEVKRVKSGVRTSLVYFVSDYGGENRRHALTE